MIKAAAISCLIFLALTVPAAALTDAATGLTITPAAPFTAFSLQNPQADATIGIRSTTGIPAAMTTPVSGATAVVCLLVYTTMTEHAGLSQAEINRSVVTREWMNSVQDGLKGLYRRTEFSRVQVDGVAGIEYTGMQFDGSGYAYAAILTTAKGQTELVCNTEIKEFAAALPLFRKIRDTIRAPR
jgi:hypothetical protein